MGTDGDDDWQRAIYGPEGAPPRPEPEAPTEPFTPEDAVRPAPPPAAAAPPPAPPSDGEGRPQAGDRRRVLIAAGVALVVALLATAFYLADDGSSADPGQAAPRATTTTLAPTTTVALTLEATSPPGARGASTAPPPTITRTASSGCPPTGAPAGAVDRFAWTEETPGSDVYLINVGGTVTNGTGATIRVDGVEVAVMRAGTQVASVTVPAGRTLAPGQVLEWWREGARTAISGGAPDAGVVSNVVFSCVR
jgi:hypothetical protein